MRRFTIIAVAASVLLTGSITASQSQAKDVCQTKKCERRVALREFAKAHGGCRSQACVARVRVKHWVREYAKLPAAMKATLRRLRGCETRGIPYPKNYRWKGHHRGAYQYDFATWAEAGGSGDPADAHPREQDVRTARFFPSHRGRWACSA